MIVYIETNFVLEMALLQEEHTHCEAILALCDAGQVGLVVPAFSFAEPYETLERRRRERLKLHNALSQELRQLARTRLYRDQATAGDDVASLLARSADEDAGRLDATVTRLLALADTIPLDDNILRSAFEYQRQHALSPQDAIVYASVMAHLAEHRPELSCFVSKDAEHFGNPDVVAALDGRRCKILFNFENGLGYIRSVLKGPHGATDGAASAESTCTIPHN